MQLTHNELAARRLFIILNASKMRKGRSKGVLQLILPKNSSPTPETQSVFEGAREAARTITARNAGLDLLRFIAVVLVLLSHATFSPDSFPAPLASVLNALRKGGWIGVDLFFVLSGFLVSGLLFSDHQRHGRASIGIFLLRRGLKIYPAFWVLLAYTCFSIVRRGVPFSSRDFAGEILFVQNYVGHFWGYTWSLAVEEHFYLGLALFVALMQRRRERNPFNVIPCVFLGIALLCLALRSLTAIHEPVFDWYKHMAPTHLRIDSLFFGVFLAYCVRYSALMDFVRPIPRLIRIAAGLAMFLPAFFLHREDHRWLTIVGFNLFYLGGGLLVLAVCDWHFAPGRLVRILSSLGAASYSIYLWHGPFNTWSARFVGQESSFQDRLYLATYIISALTGGLIMNKLVELPILRIRDRYFRSPSTEVVGSRMLQNAGAAAKLSIPPTVPPS